LTSAVGPVLEGASVLRSETLAGMTRLLPLLFGCHRARLSGHRPWTVADDGDHISLLPKCTAAPLHRAVL